MKQDIVRFPLLLCAAVLLAIGLDTCRHREARLACEQRGAVYQCTDGWTNGLWATQCGCVP